MIVMLRKYLVVILWFPLTGILLLINLALLLHRPNQAVALSYSPISDSAMQVTAAAGSGQVLSASVIGADARALLLTGFLREHGSPMAPHAEFIVSEADRNGLDYRLLVAIAMCESNLGKRMPSNDSFNPFGIAVYTGQQSGKKFDGWEHAVTWVSEYIKSYYYDRGIYDLRDIGAIWAPPSVETNYSWTSCVEEFQGKIL